MKVGILTPVHPGSFPYLGDAARSLALQTYSGEMDWALLPNNGLRAEDLESLPGLRNCVTAGKGQLGFSVLPAIVGPVPTGVGELKLRLCTALQRWGCDILVELDADDLLAPDAIEKIVAAFKSTLSPQMVYSHAVRFRTDGRELVPFSADYGWSSYSVGRPIEWLSWFGSSGIATRCWEPGPLSFGRIIYAPDHVRAWRTFAYFNVGGHLASMPVGDDHDLCARFYAHYGAAGIMHIPEPLYWYRVRDDQTSQVRLEEITRAQWETYHRHMPAMLKRWCGDEGLDTRRLGESEGPGSVDLPGSGAEREMDLRETWNLPSDSVGVLTARHVFEHLPDPIHAMNEAWRVLAHGGVLRVEVPSTDGAGAFQDPTHVSFWNENSFAYYADEALGRFIRNRGWVGRFQQAALWTSEMELGGTLLKGRSVPIVNCDLVAIKPEGQRLPGLYL